MNRTYVRSRTKLAHGFRGAAATLEPVEAPVLGGERVCLRATVPGDAQGIAEIRALPEVARWWRPRDAEYLRRKISRDDLACWVVELEDVVVGFVQAYEEDDPEYRHAGIDLFLHPDHHGKGLGRETVQLVGGYLVGDRGNHRLVIDPAAANERAIRCYEAVGFRPIGVAREYWWDDAEERWADGLLMDCLAEELVRPSDAH